MSLPTPDTILTPEEFDEMLSHIDKGNAYAALHQRYTEALDREAAFTAAMDEFLDDEIVDALDRPKPCLRVMGVVRGDGSIVTKGAM